MSFVLILLLDQTSLTADEDLQLLAQLEHLHPAPRDGGLLGGLPQLVDPLGEDPVLHRDGVDSLLEYQMVLVIVWSAFALWGFRLSR